MDDKYNVSTLTELWDLLDRHDWYYAMSDDHRCWVAGERAREQLYEAAGRIPGGKELMGDFGSHYFTGEPWGNEKTPKPKRGG